MGAWRFGLTLVVTVLTLAMTALAILDIVFELRNAPAVGERMQLWARRYPLVALSLTVFFGALIGHLFLNKGI